MPTIDVQGISIFYRRYQTGNSKATNCPPLVLIHGAGGRLMNWPPQLRRLDGRSIYALDLPGHGSSGGSGLSTIEAYRDSVLAFADALSLCSFAAVGHSMGGAIALSLALHRPERISRLILLGTAAALPVAPRLLDGLTVDYASTVNWLMPLLFAEKTDVRLRDEYRQQLLSIAPGLVLNDFLACNAFDVRDRLSIIRVPTLFICGDTDKMTPAARSKTLYNQLPDAELHVINEAGHMVMVEQPAATVAVIQQFL